MHRPWRTPDSGSALEKKSKTACKAVRTWPCHCESRFASALYQVTARGNGREPIPLTPLAWVGGQYSGGLATQRAARGTESQAELSFGARLTGSDSYGAQATQEDRTLAQRQLPNRRNVPSTCPPFAEPALDIDYAKCRTQQLRALPQAPRRAWPLLRSCLRICC